MHEPAMLEPAMLEPDQPLPSAHAAAAAAAAAAFAKESEAARRRGGASEEGGAPSLAWAAVAGPSSSDKGANVEGAYVAKSVAEKKWPMLSPRSAVAKEEELTRLSMLPPGLIFSSEITEQEAMLGLRGGGLRELYS